MPFVREDFFLYRLFEGVTVKDLQHPARLLNVILVIVVIYELLQYYCFVFRGQQGLALMSRAAAAIPGDWGYTGHEL